MKRWTLEDIPWESFDPSKVAADIVPIVKTASLVEYNAGDYAAYLRNVFADDPAFQEAAAAWATEEEQHGQALGKWAEIADRGFNFEASFARFIEGYQIPVDATRSVRGTRSGELIARCVVESGTSSLYSALRDATDEPVLKAICHRIAVDEFRHYRLFYTHLQGYLPAERPGLIRRLLVVCERFLEVGDDELAYAYHCANEWGRDYDRGRANAAYAGAVARCYQRGHVDRAIGMMLKAGGVSAASWLGNVARRIAWLHVRRKQRRALAA